MNKSLKRESKRETLPLIIIVVGFLTIPLSPIIFDPNPEYEDYRFAIRSHSDEILYINELYFNLDYTNNNVNISFDIYPKSNHKESAIIVDYPLSLNFSSITIINKSNGYELQYWKDYNLSNGTEDGIRRRWSVIEYPKEKFNETLEIFLHLSGVIYPEGNYLFEAHDALSVNSKYLYEDPIGMTWGRVNFYLGDYKCESQCVTNTFIKHSQDIGYFILPSQYGERIKVLDTGRDGEIKDISLILNTFNEQDKYWRDLFINFGIALLSGGIIMLITIKK